MDLRLYYQKVRDVSSKIEDVFPIVVSRETDDGGKGGILTEVTRAVAAKMVVEGLARLASAEEAEGFRRQQAEAKRSADHAAAVTRVQVAVLSAEELTTLRDLTPSKG
ncbi:MAG TPA: hypothetical protein VGH38_35740 [Bryobacteraceae bacterium]|jgi:uncharacterized membrane protein